MQEFLDALARDLDAEINRLKAMAPGLAFGTLELFSMRLRAGAPSPASELAEAAPAMTPPADSSPAKRKGTAA